MKITYIVCGVALLLAAILSSGGSSLAVELGFTMQEIRDPQMNNAVAARVAVPQGWVLKEQRVPWNMGTYAAPAHVFYTLRGPKRRCWKYSPPLSRQS